MDLFKKFEEINFNHSIECCRDHMDEPETLAELKSHQKVIDDLLKMMCQGTSHDVTIVLEDGEISANKDLLRARCQYFSTMLGTDNFEEGKTNIIPMKSVKKKLMEKVVRYIYSGEVDLVGLDNHDVLRLMDLARYLLLDDIYQWLSAALSTVFEEGIIDFCVCGMDDDEKKEMKELEQDIFAFVEETFPLLLELKLDDLKEDYLRVIEEKMGKVYNEKKEEIEREAKKEFSRKFLDSKFNNLLSDQEKKKIMEAMAMEE